MKELNFPEISKEIQQSVYGAWGGSNSQNQDVDYYIPLDEVVVGGGGGSGDSGGSGGGFDWGGSGGIGDDGGYDYGSGGGGGGGADYGDNFISADSFINVAEGDATEAEFYDVDSKVRAAVNATGLAAGFTGTSLDGITAITKELGFTVKTFAKVGTGIGVAGVTIGAVETVIAVKEVVTGEDPWTDTDTLNAMATVLGAAALVPGPHSIICGGLSVMIGMVGTAYSN